MIFTSRFQRTCQSALTSLSLVFADHPPLLSDFHIVRECLQFSALLRQPSSISREDYLLELGPIADALVGNPEVGGLGVEKRKRLTISVELAAKPDLLLFLDERTSFRLPGISLRKAGASNLTIFFDCSYIW